MSARAGISRRSKTVVAILIGAIAVFPLADRRVSGAADASPLVSRGKYIVEKVSMCVHCHTPRNPSGRLILSQYLRGAPVPVKAPPYPGMRWALKAPAIAGLPGYTKEEGVRLLMEGITAGGIRPNPPMPPFRFNRADAEAVVAYLKSIE